MDPRLFQLVHFLVIFPTKIMRVSFIPKLRATCLFHPLPVNFVICTEESNFEDRQYTSFPQMWQWNFES